MRKADFEARIKKIEIVNRVLNDSFEQNLRVVLDEVAVTNENLLELRQFRPNEAVMVTITAQQVNMLELLGPAPEAASKNEEEEELLIEGDDIDRGGGQVVKEWKFSI